jgi:Flp pilus assembly pilin Flp
MQVLHRLLRLGCARAPDREVGASTVEYALIVFAIAATMVVALVALGPPVHGLFDTTCTSFSDGITASGGASAGCS